MDGLSAMNWRRGLFRLWIVGTALFVIAVASLSYSGIKAEFEAAVAFKQFKQTGPRTFEFTSPEGKTHELSGPEGATAEQAWEILQQMGGHPWVSVGWSAAVAFGIPLVVLILGASLVWAFSGFAATTRRPN
jgi:hypothetical protein